MFSRVIGYQRSSGSILTSDVSKLGQNLFKCYFQIEYSVHGGCLQGRLLY
nr:MAG TPA: hypothetical protein [Caudoviricetes sp.]